MIERFPNGCNPRLCFKLFWTFRIEQLFWRLIWTPGSNYTMPDAGPKSQNCLSIHRKNAELWWIMYIINLQEIRNTKWVAFLDLPSICTRPPNGPALSGIQNNPNGASEATIALGGVLHVPPISPWHPILPIISPYHFLSEVMTWTPVLLYLDGKSKRSTIHLQFPNTCI